MIYYRNTSSATKTFYGVTFNPGEVKAVSGYINNDKFVKVDASELPVKPVEKPKTKADPAKSTNKTTKTTKEEK